jgi:hypothetical protein
MRLVDLPQLILPVGEPATLSSALVPVMKNAYIPDGLETCILYFFFCTGHCNVMIGYEYAEPLVLC